MTQAEIRAKTRTLIHEASTDLAALMPADNILLDSFIDTALKFVTLELVRTWPQMFTTYEDITLIAAQQNYSLSKAWLQIMTINRNVAGQNPTPLEFIERHSELYFQYVGETAADPIYYTLVGEQIYFIPKPSVNKTAYCRVWFTQYETTLPCGGSVLIPSIAHDAISFKAAQLIAESTGADGERWEKNYIIFMKMATDLLSARIQGQPKYLNEPFRDMRGRSTADPAFYDRYGFFER